MLYRIMTNNQWKIDTNTEGWIAKGLNCSAPVRAKQFAKIYNELKADIIGLQEVSNYMLEELVKDLKEVNLNYAVLWGRDTPILFNPEKFEVLDYTAFVYPENIEGLEGSFNNDKTKSFCLAVFKTKQTGKVFVFVTTHLWWKNDDINDVDYQAHSSEARVWQLKLVDKYIKEYSEKYNCPAILVGDLNAYYNSSPIQTVLELGYKHAHDIATDYKDETEGWHLCRPNGDISYTMRDFSYALDHILLKNFENNRVKRFDRYTPDYFYTVSDHSPAFIDIEL